MKTIEVKKERQQLLTARTKYTGGFESALADGQCVLRQVFVNENSTKDQVTLQFVQRFALGAELSLIERMVLSAQVGNVTRETEVTYLFSMSAAVAADRGLQIGEYWKELPDEVITLADTMRLDEEMSLQIVENTTQDKNYNQSPKRKGADGPVITDEEGRPIYRHISPVVGTPNHVLLRGSGEMAWEDYEKSLGTTTTTTEVIEVTE